MAKSKSMTFILTNYVSGKWWVDIWYYASIVKFKLKDRNLHICPFEDISNNMVDYQIKQVACAPQCSPEQHFQQLIWHLHNVNGYMGTIITLVIIN